MNNKVNGFCSQCKQFFKSDQNIKGHVIFFNCKQHQEVKK